MKKKLFRLLQIFIIVALIYDIIIFSYTAMIFG
nr:MAG TPA: hypothetical protein [Caudoviricetes sp.]